MSLLNDLRLLLIDARIALRNEMEGFDDDPLRTRMDQAIHDITEYVMPPPSATTKTTAAQVALAWQTASRSLKMTHPPLYDELAAKVMGLLDEKELVEPVTELLQLGEEVKKLEASRKTLQGRITELGKKGSDAQMRIDQLYQALERALPAQLGSEPHTLALARLEALVAKGRPSELTSVAKAAPAPASAPADAPIPPRERLALVAAGNGTFTREQREWAIAECMTLTSWQFTPLELIEKGDAWMAQRMLGNPTA
jgi:hypothetical protein